MNDIYNAMIVIFISVMYILIVFIFSSFSYDIIQTSIKMKWKILKYVLIGSRTVQIENIQEVRSFIFKKDVFPGGYIFGNVLSKKCVVLVLRKRVFLMKKIFITPINPDDFIERVNNLLKIHENYID